MKVGNYLIICTTVLFLFDIVITWGYVCVILFSLFNLSTDSTARIFCVYFIMRFTVNLQFCELCINLSIDKDVDLSDMDSILTILLLLADTSMKRPTQTIGHGDQYLPVVVYNKKVMHIVFSYIQYMNGKNASSTNYVQKLVK